MPLESGMRGYLITKISGLWLFGIYLDEVYFILMEYRFAML